MIVGVPKEIKNSETRVAMTPEGVRELISEGHEVLVEEAAGVDSDIADRRFREAGAKTGMSADQVFDEAELIVKVKEPLPEEFERLHKGQILFTFLHLAVNQLLTEALVDRGVSAIAYETVQDSDGRLPLLAPMSEIAGRMSAHVGARYLERPSGGRGVLMGGATGVEPAQVVVLGAGIAGMNAAAIACGMEAQVTIVDRDLSRLRQVDMAWRGHIRTVASSAMSVERLVEGADLVVGAVLVPGARAPKLVSEDLVRGMRPGAVIVDVSIDQGGCVATAHVTSHVDPVYIQHEVVHYCVGNMPGAVPRTATYALTNATLPYVLLLACRGLMAAVDADECLAYGLNVHGGQVVNVAVAEATGLPLARQAS